MSYCEHIDEWCMDRITGEFGDSLEHLNISGCRALNWNGLECVWRLRSLKTLVIKDMEHVQDSAVNEGRRRFVITEKAPTRSFSWLKVPSPL